jgi:oligopeptide/dipeptide ABC transporter ATP-binding protein
MILQVKNLKKYYPSKRGLLKAVDDVSFAIAAGETLGLVGESGCGKSTLGRTLLRLKEATSGSVLFDNKNIFDFSPSALKQWRKEAQLIFQDPYASLNPRMTAEDTISEPFYIHNLVPTKERIHELFEQVNLSPAHRRRFPHEFSGGQRQRIGIARALALMPRFIVCDEPISALDVSVQAQIVNLLKELQKTLQLTYLFISHDLRMVKYVADRVGVMYLGTLVELAPTSKLYTTPLHPYTEALLSAVPIPDPQIEKKRTRIVLSGEVPSPLNPPKGCPFCTRCPKVMDICHKERPKLLEVSPGHKVACHLYPDALPK